MEPSKLGSTTGMTPVYDFVLSAKKSVDITMYELVDPTMVGDLIADHKRHVKVRVILDTNREATRNGPAFRSSQGRRRKGRLGRHQLRGDASKDHHGRRRQVADPVGAISPTSTTRRPVISASSTATRRTSRLSRPSSSADFAHEPIKPSNGSDLVWSPGSQAEMLAVINGASHTLSIENEEMGDWTSRTRSWPLPKRGVKVEVTMTRDSSYDSDWTAIVSAGGHVHLYSDA